MKVSAALLLSAAAAGASLSAAADTVPEQVHIAVAGQDADGDPSGFSFAWFTQDETQLSQVEFLVESPDGTTVNGTVNGTAAQYLEKHGYHHVARATGWKADSKVTYRVGSADSGWSEPFVARVAPDQDTDRTIKLSVFGDMGYSDSDKRKMVVTVDGLVKTWSAEYSRQVLEELKDNGDIEMVWHVGDIGYADDAFAHDPIEFLYEKAYNGYMNWLQNLTATMPYMVAVGNHESECHSGVCIAELKTALALSNFSAYNKRWHMPSVESGGHPGSNMWYSWNYGPVHFVSVNTETDWPGAGEEKTGDSNIPWLKAGGFGHDGEYLAWVEADLKAASEARANGGRPWIVAGGHRPYDEVKDTLGPLFLKYGVDMYVAGHGHSYSRSVPSSANYIEKHHEDGVFKDPAAPVWIMVGGAGCEEMAQGNNNQYPGMAAPIGAEDVQYFRYATGVLEANKTALFWRLIDSVNKSVIDEITITK